MVENIFYQVNEPLRKQSKGHPVGIRVVWDNEAQTIIRHIYEDPWSTADYYAHIDQHYVLLEQRNHVLDIINDLRNTSQLPNDIVTAVRSASQKTHPNEGVIVMVGANNLFRSLIQVMYRVADNDIKNIVMVDTMDEAYEIITTERAKRTATEDSSP
jgi:hypothetical protein